MSETCSWRSPEPLHGESEVPASALKAGQRLDRTASGLRQRLISQPSSGGSQEVRQGSPRGWEVGEGNPSSSFSQERRCQILGRNSIFLFSGIPWRKVPRREQARLKKVSLGASWTVDVPGAPGTAVL